MISTTNPAQTDELAPVDAFARWMAGVDRLVHEPNRLAILTLLRERREMKFMPLQQVLGIRRGNLSIHLRKLEEAGLISVYREIENTKTATTLRLTEKGRTAIEGYWSAMQTLIFDPEEFET